MIATEACNKKPNIALVTHGGTRTRADAMNQANLIHEWFKKEADPQSLFDPRKDKETYMQAMKEVIRE
jgi:hypothetical protein